MNADIMALWEAVSTQWRAGGFGVIGLDYEEVRSWAWDLMIELTPRVWNGIKALERFELRRMNKSGTESNDKDRRDN